MNIKRTLVIFLIQVLVVCIFTASSKAKKQLPGFKCIIKNEELLVNKQNIYDEFQESGAISSIFCQN